MSARFAALCNTLRARGIISCRRRIVEYLQKVNVSKHGSILSLALLAACVAVPETGHPQFISVHKTNDALRNICGKDDGSLWGVSLCGPLLVVDPKTRAVWASEPDNDGALKKVGDSWVGVLPRGVPVANTSVEWAGRRWIMLLGPLPDDEEELRVLVAHEAWHRIQESIGFPAQSSNARHLEQKRGRYLLRLELRALSRALLASGDERVRAAKDAIVLRNARFAEYPDAAKEEIALDRNEGLASFTGVRLGAGPRATAYAVHLLDTYDEHDAFARSYAYASGPAYGLLLDEYAPGWRNHRGAKGPADLLTSQWGGGSDLNQIATIARRYGGEQIAIEENKRADVRKTRFAELKRAYTEESRVILPLVQIQMEFDPSRVTPVEGLGSIYGALTVRDAWGEFQSNEEALISEDFKKLVALAPASDGMSGPGWALRLNEGYRLAPPDTSGARRLTIDAAPAVRFDDLRFEAEVSFDHPTALSAAKAAFDVAVLRRALEEGYGGRNFVSDDVFRSVIHTLNEVGASAQPSVSAFCNQLADVLWALPDNHLAVYTAEGRCGTPESIIHRAGNVGRNIAAQSNSEIPPAWSVYQFEAAGRTLPVLSIARLPPPEDTAWQGYDQALKSLLAAPALIVDLRGNGGGSDARGFQLADTLLGYDHQNYFEAIVHRQSPEAFLLRLNSARASQRRYERRGEPVPDYLADQQREYEVKIAEARAGAIPQEDVYESEVATPPDDAPAFDKAVLVLADADCASSCEGTMLALKTHPNAIIVGENTGGYLQFGNTGLLVLPHSRIAVQIPTTFIRLRGNAAYEKTGIPPDIAVAPGTDAIDAAEAWLEEYFAAAPREPIAAKTAE